MPAPNFHSLNALLNNDGSQLKLLSDEARQRSQLRDVVRRHLPPALAPHCVAAQIDADTLIIYMDSAVTATPVRYQQGDLLGKFAGDGLRYQSLKVQVLPEQVMQPVPKPTVTILSNAVRHILETTAAQLDDGPLKHSLQHLARNRNKHF